MLQEHWRSKVKKALFAAATAVVVLFLFQYVVPFLFPWTPLNCWTESMDIMSGSYRYQRYVLWIKMCDRTEETELSKLYRELVGEPPPPAWRPVNTFSPVYRYSPHYGHHSSLHASRQLVKALRTARFTDEAKKAAILNFLGLLQEDDGDWRAEQYANRVLRLAFDVTRHDDALILAERLPPLPKKE